MYFEFFFSYQFKALESSFLYHSCLVVFLQYLWIVENVMQYVRYDKIENFQKVSKIWFLKQKTVFES